MKLRIKLLLLSIVLLYLIPVSLAQNTQEHIPTFISSYTINTDGTVDVEEQIVYNFGNLERHGIIREIDFKRANSEGKQFIIDINNITVTNEKGEKIRFDESDSGEIKILKIGDPDRTISGTHKYIINYSMSGALTYFDNHDELYWSPTGNNWEVPIYSVSTQISIPSQKFNQAVCFTGVTGSTDSKCTTKVNLNNATISSLGVINPGEGLTFAVDIPKGVVALLEPREDVTPIIEKIITALIIFAVFIAGIFWYVLTPIYVLRKWLSERENIQRAKVTSAWFDAPKLASGKYLTPAQTSVILDSDVGHNDVTATVINLAQRGFIKIKQDGKDFIIDKEKAWNDDNSVLVFEKYLLDSLLGLNNSVNLKNLAKDSSFTSKVSSFRDKVAKSLVEHGIFKKNPQNSFYGFMGLAGFALTTANIFLAVVAYLARHSAPRTEFGIEKYGEAKSLKNFLTSQDDKLEFQADKQLMFEKLLPYATAFGVENIWIKRFESLNLPNPEWLETTNVRAFNYNSFSRGFVSSMTKASSYSSNKSSSGFSGGSSGGGGGGGGGGGSW